MIENIAINGIKYTLVWECVKLKSRELHYSDKCYSKSVAVLNIFILLSPFIFSSLFKVEAHLFILSSRL